MTNLEYTQINKTGAFKKKDRNHECPIQEKKNGSHKKNPNRYWEDWNSAESMCNRLNEREERIPALEDRNMISVHRINDILKITRDHEENQLNRWKMNQSGVT